jgi:tRNA(Met) C34 N-acetyltransferase TmcA
LGNKLIGLNADLLESYQKVMEKQKQESVTTLQNIISEMKQEVSEEVDEFTGVLHEGTVGVQKQVEQKIKEELLQSEKDLEKYEQDKLTKIDENIYQIAYKTSQMVLGQAISMKDHEDLVRRSLEQAKREIGVG